MSYHINADIVITHHIVLVWFHMKRSNLIFNLNSDLPAATRPNIDRACGVLSFSIIRLLVLLLPRKLHLSGGKALEKS
jgi:hypothetical protein